MEYRGFTITENENKEIELTLTAECLDDMVDFIETRLCVYNGISHNKIKHFEKD